MLWFVAGMLAFVLALYPMSATLAGGIYVPADADSFYHGQRILAAVASPAHLYQFDPRMHAPEGSWVSWPWAYDMMMAAIAHIAVYAFAVKDPMSVLAYVAPLWTFVNAALMLSITSRLELSFPVKALALLCYAASPLTQALHRVGMLDHHYVEYSFVLGTLLLGLNWFQQFGNVRRAAALGVLLGAAPAFHDGLFIMQLPVLATLGLRWILGRPGEPRAVATFAIALLLATFAFLLPSAPFRAFIFSFGLQSWFHLYIAACTGVVALELSMLRRSKASLAWIAVSAIVLGAVIVGQAMRGGHFLSGRLAGLEEMSEVKGIAAYLAEGDFHFLMANYSGLIWLVPPCLAVLCWRLKFEARDSDLFFVVMTVTGVLLMLQQYRLENYGSFALYLPLCRLVEWSRRRWNRNGHRITAAAALLTGVAYVPAYGQLTAHVPLGANYDYEMTRAIYPALARACDSAPGIVLADNSDGHYITFHTRCSVIANNFILSSEDEAKLLEAQALMQSQLAEVLVREPQLRYIYVRRNDNVFVSRCGASCPENRGLRAELLFAEAPYPAQLKLLGEIRVKVDADRSEPLARAFAIVRPLAPVSDAPAPTAATH